MLAEPQATIRRSTATMASRWSFGGLFIENEINFCSHGNTCIDGKIGALCYGRCGRYPPEVRTAIPVEGRFEHIVLSCNTTSDHAILWIERESQKAFNRIKESAVATDPPLQQKMERKLSIEQEHKDALERAVSLNVPHAVTSTEQPCDDTDPSPSENQGEATSHRSSKSSRTKWDELVEKLFIKNASGNLVLKRDINVTD